MDVPDLLPNDIEAEQAVLGSMLLSSDATWAVADILRPTDFYRLAHPPIFEAITDCWRELQACDPMLLERKLGAKLENVGGSEYILALADKVPTSANAAHYAQIVKDKSILRRAITVTTTTADALHNNNGTPPAETVSRFVTQMSDILRDEVGTDIGSAKELVGELWDSVDAAYKQGHATLGLPTGISHLDNIMGGLEPKNLYMIAARPGLGKTALALQILTHNAKQGTPCGMISLEMSKHQLVMRMVATETGIPLWKFKSGNLSPDEWATFATATATITALPLYICDEHCSHIDQIQIKARRMVGETHIRLVAVDYAGLIQASGIVGKRVEEVGFITSRLKSLASDLNIPLIVVCQMNREVEKRTGAARRPQLSDLRESGSLEAEAFSVWFLWRPNAADEEAQLAPTDIYIAKHRQGSLGTIKTMFEGSRFRFNAVDETHEERSLWYGAD